MFCGQKSRRPEGARSVALDEEVDVADMVGLEHDRDRGRLAVEPFPHLVALRLHRVEHGHLAG